MLWYNNIMLKFMLGCSIKIHDNILIVIVCFLWRQIKRISGHLYANHPMETESALGNMCRFSLNAVSYCMPRKW